MPQAIQLIILNTTKTGEKSLVLHCLSKEWGRRSFIVNAGKGMAAYLPLNIIEAEVQESTRSSLWRLKGVALVHPLNGIRGSVAKNSITMFMSEVLYRSIREGANEEGLFEWCCKSILTLDALQSDFSNYHLRFLLELAAALGFAPTMQDLAPFAGERYEHIKVLVQSDFGTCMLLPLTGSLRSEIADAMLRYLGYHLDCQLNIRSLRVLGELFA